MRTLHDSDVEFPEYILSKKINWYLDHMEIKTLLEDLKGNKRINEIINESSKLNQMQIVIII